MKWFAEVFVPLCIAGAIGVCWLFIIAGLMDIWPERHTIGK